MIIITAMMIISFVAALALTPVVKILALKFNIVDLPDRRKMHDLPVPRIGGLAILLAFYISFSILLFPKIVEKSWILTELSLDHRIMYLIIGSIIAFGLGFGDDIRGFGPIFKIFVQIIAASIAFWGGIRIDFIQIPYYGIIHFGYASFPLTVFWIILVINAINLLDGLDGLAAGISFFVCLVLLTLCLMNSFMFPALLLASLCGSLLGFLRYNFNPASIFMGDSGSYFIGYLLATFSIIGSIKSHAVVAIMIPIIALGVPIVDTIWSTLRRFAIGKNIFKPDDNHFHHKLIRLGYSHKKAVLILYVSTILLGVLALILVNIRDERSGFILLCITIALVPFYGIRRLGYFNYLEINSIRCWIRDWIDEIGISRERREFLNFSIQIYNADCISSLWSRIVNSIDRLGFDQASLRLSGPFSSVHIPEIGRNTACKYEAKLPSGIVPNENFNFEFSWNRESPSMNNDDSFNKLRLELPLMVNGGTNFGILILQRNLKTTPMSHFTLKRIEHLRRAVVRKLEKNNFERT